MIKLINGFLVLTVLVVASTLYSLEYTTRGLERQTAHTKREISENVEAIKLLNAEWSSLTRPDRIQKLAEQNLKLSTLTAEQFVSLKDLLEKVPDAPEVVLEENNNDPIGDILKKMQ